MVEILTFISKDKPQAAIDWVEKIESKCVAIAGTPEIGQQMPQLGKDVRGSLLGRYIIFHRYVDGRLEVLRVIPGGADVTEL